MNKILALVFVSLCLSHALTETVQLGNIVFSTPVQTPTGKSQPSLFDVWPVVDAALRINYWQYIRGASPLYQASIDSPQQYIFFTIYRNLGGTYLVSTRWTKKIQTTHINTFVRLGNGYNAVIYEPVNINPFVIDINLAPNEYMVTTNADGTVSVSGNVTLYNLMKDAGLATFDVTADMNSKSTDLDGYIRELYWYYLTKANLVTQSSIATNTQYYYVFIYINPIGTFLTISHYNLADKSKGVNTFVRLGDGFAEGADFGPVNLSPSVVTLNPIN